MTRAFSIALVSVAFFSLALGGCLVSPDAPTDCRSSAQTCGECIQLAGCGWCNGVGCVAGTETAQDANAGGGAFSCPANDYLWDTCTPRVDPCQVHASRDQCVLANGCDWCPGGGCRIRNGCGGAAPPPPTTRCTNECQYAADGACDDGGPSSDYSICDLGTDCADCGPR